MIEDILIRGARWGPRYLSKIEKYDYDRIKQRPGSNVVYGKKPEELLKLCDHNGDFRIEKEYMRVLKVKEGNKEIPFEEYHPKVKLWKLKFPSIRNSRL